ncbi:MAG: hypothetical protein HY736_23870 [Verrucomicrobia bacterium]|nr:hypothetical protein [Verrucomicrobiota bacterium]
MKTITKSVTLAPQRRRGAHTRPAPKLSDEEFRHQLHHELADELAAARQAARKRFGHMLRPLTPAEIKARSVRVRAMFARWEEEERKNPPSREECESYDRMLARMRAERAG